MTEPLANEDSDPEETWTSLFAALHAADIPEDFMAERPMNRLPIERDIFGEDPKGE